MKGANMKQSKNHNRKKVKTMKDKVDIMMDKKVKVELKVQEFYLLSLIACRGVSLSKRILKTETTDEELLEVTNFIIKKEIPRIAHEVMDQIGMFKIVDIFSELNKKEINKQFKERKKSNE